MTAVGQETSRLLFVLGYFVALTVVGTVGYMEIEGWSWEDSLYMTVTTETAIGFNEVHPLSSGGRYWTMLVLGGGLTGLGMWFALVTSWVVRMDVGKRYKRRRTMKRASRCRDHVVVCGVGAMGRRVAHELQEARKPCVLVEHDQAAVRALRKSWSDALIVEDDATNDGVLREAGIENAMGLVACLSSDTDNLFVCLSARHLNPALVVVVRAEGDAATAKMRRAGADHVVSPNVTGAIWVASVLARPSVASFLGAAAPGPQLSRHLEQVTVGRDARLAGTTLAQARIPSKTGLVVIALRKAESSTDDLAFNPGADTTLEPGDDLIVMGTGDQIRNLREYLS